MDHNFQLYEFFCEETLEKALDSDESYSKSVALNKTQSYQPQSNSQAGLKLNDLTQDFNQDSTTYIDMNSNIIQSNEMKSLMKSSELSSEKLNEKQNSSPVKSPDLKPDLEPDQSIEIPQRKSMRMKKAKIPFDLTFDLKVELPKATSRRNSQKSSEETSSTIESTNIKTKKGGKSSCPSLIKKPIKKPGVSVSASNSNAEKKPKAQRLYCLCLKPWNNEFMIMCTYCENWYHGRCEDLTKDQTQEYLSDKTLPYECKLCKRLPHYCLCNTPNDNTPYIGCGKCEKWYHIRCVNITLNITLEEASAKNFDFTCEKINEKCREES